MTTQRTTYPEVNAPSALRTSHDGRSFTDSIGEVVPELTGKLRHIVETGKTRVTEWKGGFQGGVREKPIQSILIAVAVGAVIGLIVGRRSA